MDSTSIQQLSKFILDQQLKSPDTTIAFDAVVTFYRYGKPHTIFSEIQIITLPKEMVLYVLEFIKDTYTESDIYTTSNYLFFYNGINVLEVRDTQYKDLLLFTIQPLQKTGINETATE